MGIKMTTWTAEDQIKAHHDGWGIFMNSDHGLQIERLDDPYAIGIPSDPFFMSDEDAARHVAIKAAAGDFHAQKALNYVRNNR